MRDWLSYRATVSPAATAVVETGTDESWTYADLDAAVDETAGALAGAGLRAGDHLGVLMETRPAYVRLVHAAMRLGVVLVGLNARLTPTELAGQCDWADLTALVCATDTEPAAVAAADVPVLSVDDPTTDEVRALGSFAGAFEPAEWALSDPQVMLFTSGTTGAPKGVVLTPKNLLASATASAFRLGVLPGDRWLLSLSMYHMGGLSPVVRTALYGTTLVLQRGFDPVETGRALPAYDVTGVSLVPTMLRRVLDAAETEGFDPAPESLRFVLLGGAPARDELVARCADAGVPVCPSYGMTETASHVTAARPEEAFTNRGTVGRPLVFDDVTVVGDEGNPLPPGEPGELVVSGPVVMDGYYGDPEATRAAFGPHGFHTGDVGYRDEAGRLWVLNRRSDRIVTGGENVHPGEVVDALRDHPDVREAAVVGLADPEWGERVGALVVPEEGATLTESDVLDHCASRLAGYKRPRTIRFAAELPRTASGTVEREAVRDLLTASE